MIKELGPGFRLTLIFTILTRTAIPGGDDRHISAYFPEAGERQPGDRQRKGCRFELDRTALLQARVFSSRGLRRRAADTTAGCLRGSNLGPTSAKLLRGTTKTDDKKNEVVDFDGISLRVVHYCLDNDIPYESSVPLDQFKDAQGNLDDAKLIKAFNDEKAPLVFTAKAPIPADAVTASSSGLDPHISPANAEVQAARVAKARGASADQVKQLIAESTDRQT